MDFILLFTITFSLLILSFIKSREKTLKTLKMAGKRCLKILPVIFLTVLMISISFYFIPPEKLSEYMGRDNRFIAMIMAALVGSISIIPGFIAFPLGGVLREAGIPYMVIAAFTSTLMMVGIITIPLERQYLGLKVALWRNLIYLVIALMVSLITGVVFGELI